MAFGNGCKENSIAIGEGDFYEGVFSARLAGGSKKNLKVRIKNTKILEARSIVVDNIWSYCINNYIYYLVRLLFECFHFSNHYLISIVICLIRRPCFRLLFCGLIIMSPLGANSANMSDTRHALAEEKKEKMELSNKIDTLNNLLAKQSERIIALERNTISQSSDGMNFAIWTGILLTVVAVLVTTLGVVMAIFSFFGYKKIMSGAKEVATKIAILAAERTAKSITPEATKEVLIGLVNGGNFKEVIDEAVERSIYRGTELPGQDELDGEVQ